MSAFPFFVELEGKSCLVVGGGKVAQRKAQVLLSFGPKVTVVAPEIQREIKENTAVTILERPFRETDIQDGYDFVIAASDDSRVNDRVSEL